MENNAKLEVASKIMAVKIAVVVSKKGYKVEDEEIQLLMKEKEEMKKGNKEVIDKIIKEYGPEVKGICNWYKVRKV